MSTAYTTDLVPANDWRGYHVWSTAHRYYACFAPKAGCTSWLHVVRMQHLPHERAHEINGKPGPRYTKTIYPDAGLYMRLRGQLHLQHKSNKWLKAEQAAVKVINDESYFKFAVVRHPWVGSPWWNLTVMSVRR